MENNNINFNSEDNADAFVPETEEHGYVSQFSDVQDNITEEYQPQTYVPENKKGFVLFKYINPCVFIALCIVLASLIAFGLYKVLLDKSITGAWIYKIPYQNTSSTPDEASKTTEEEAYYVFDKSDSKGKGVFHEFSQGAEQTGEYTLSTKNGKNKVTLQYNSATSNELNYEVTGIRLFGSAKLKLTMDAYTDQSTGQQVPEQSIELDGSSSPGYDKCTYDSFKTDDKILGKWSTDDRKFFYYYTELQYSEKLEFLDNGILKIRYLQSDMYLDRTIYYSYTVDKDTIKLKRATSKDEEKVKFSVKNGKLKFTDKTKSSVFYDEIFGGVDYKKEK